MGKPSIFSKDYDEKMKKRKRIIKILTIFAILTVIGGVVLARGNVAKEIKTGIVKVVSKIRNININSVFDNSKDKDKTKSKTVPQESATKQQKAKIQKKKQEIKKNEIKKETQVIKLSNGEEIKLVYTLSNNQKQYIDFFPKTIQCSISPSKKSVVLIENNTQNMIFIDEKGNKKDITKGEYVSSKGTVFSKASILKSNPAYIWNSLPKLLDDDNIIYVSQLPWFNRGNDKFVWKYTISTNTHKYIVGTTGDEVGGKEIQYGKLSKEGLEVIIDGNVNIVK
ncbi:hypothetical protein [Clostridium ganghwense]|uniref:tRNA (Guanine-N1)-methyltransferase n=1 Tax=Clostridium ganghwense TaxID=312089 RepID=A0ABT4CKU9_9CLOT|nr:hypothetical protein [Clostridium ganghwense]MCY6369670.1 hypothetical protein [Clostridium ganghwense]